MARPLAVIRGATPIDLIENNIVARVLHGMIPLGGRSEGPQVSLTPSGTLADPQHIIAVLRCELGESRAERDEAQRKLNGRTTERDEAMARETAGQYVP
jgi:hypothetical protein